MAEEELVEWTIQEISSNGVVKKSTMMLPKINVDTSDWCHCTKSDNEYYVPDSAESKHHWRCGICHKIVQVG